MNVDPDVGALQAQIDELRAQLMQSEKLAALGALTAGVAHEFNNPIGFVKNNVLVLSEYFDVLMPLLRTLADGDSPDAAERLAREREAVAMRGEDLAALLDDVAPLLDDTRDGLVRLEEIVGGLNRFARTDPPEGKVFDVNQCVEDTLKIMHNELKYRAKVVVDLEPLPTLSGKPGEINQVILNLLINAAQAMTGFGEIHISTRAVGDSVELRVRDNGPGIPPEVRSQLFKPFFTTKPAGAGTGLGLSISRAIVESHGGTIEAENRPDGGAEFRVTLPTAAVGAEIAGCCGARA